MDGRTEQHSIALGNTLHTQHLARRYHAGCAEYLRLVVAGTLWAWVLTLEKVSWTQLAARAGADSLMVRTLFFSCCACGRAVRQSRREIGKAFGARLAWWPCPLVRWTLVC